MHSGQKEEGAEVWVSKEEASNSQQRKSKHVANEFLLGISETRGH